MDFLIKCVNINILQAIRFSTFKKILKVLSDNVYCSNDELGISPVNYSRHFLMSDGVPAQEGWSLNQWEGFIWALDQWDGPDLTRMGKCYVTRPIGDSGGVQRLGEHTCIAQMWLRDYYCTPSSHVSGKNQTNVKHFSVRTKICDQTGVFSAAMQSSLNISSLTVHLNMIVWKKCSGFSWASWDGKLSLE